MIDRSWWAEPTSVDRTAFARDDLDVVLTPFRFGRHQVVTLVAAASDGHGGGNQEDGETAHEGNLPPKPGW